MDIKQLLWLKVHPEPNAACKKSSVQLQKNTQTISQSELNADLKTIQQPATIYIYTAIQENSANF